MSTQPGSVQPGAPRPSRPVSHRAAILRLPILVAVPLLLVGAGVASAMVGTASAPPARPAPAAVVAPAGAESSSWYCAGGGGSSGTAQATLQLTNTSSRPVAGTLTSVSSTGATGTAAVSVPARQQVAASPPASATGTWVATRVDLQGGGVAVAQVVHGSAGWSDAPCASTTGTRWYFPTGATASASSQFLSLYNPTVSPAVADLSFLTGNGLEEPQPFQGIVVPPGRLVVKNIGSFVQDKAAVATEVLVRSGRLVAAQLQQRSGGATGLALELGALSPGPRWTVVHSVNVSGGTVDLSVMNPGTAAEHVSVVVQLPSGPIPPITATVAGGTLYELPLGSQTRIPAGTGYLVRVTATGGRGVVVGRTVQVPGASSAGRPTWGANLATDDALATGASTWVLPSPGVPASLPVTGAGVSGINLAAAPSRGIHARVVAMLPTGFQLVGHGGVAVPAGGSVVLPPAGHSGQPLIVQHAPGASVTVDLGPSALTGVITMNGIPLSG